MRGPARRRTGRDRATRRAGCASTRPSRRPRPRPAPMSRSRGAPNRQPAFPLVPSFRPVRSQRVVEHPGSLARARALATASAGEEHQVTRPASTGRGPGCRVRLDVSAIEERSAIADAGTLARTGSTGPPPAARPGWAAGLSRAPPHHQRQRERAPQKRRAADEETREQTNDSPTQATAPFFGVGIPERRCRKLDIPVRKRD